METSASTPLPNTPFSLIDLGVVKDSSGASLNTKSNDLGVTNFLRPEDGAWDPVNPNVFYFVTTNAFTSPSRLWKLQFIDIHNPTLGGYITAVLDGTEGQRMLDNITIDHSGHILLQEDPGNQSYLARIWQYTIATDALKEIAYHDPNRFIQGADNFLTQDEESSGIIDAQNILGSGKFLLVDQTHYPIAGEIYEGGQILSMYNFDTDITNPEINVSGNGLDISDGEFNPNPYNNTLFGVTNVGGSIINSFEIRNNGPGNLTINSIQINGNDAFILLSPLTFPIVIPSGSVQEFKIKFAPVKTGVHTGIVSIKNNDFNEDNYDFVVQGDVLTSTDPVLTNIIILGLSPNPVTNHATLSVHVNTAEQININLYDIHGGQELLTLKKLLEAGNNEIEISTNDLKNGLYTLKLCSGSKSSQLKMIVMH
jgi:hypothetical protein